MSRSILVAVAVVAILIIGIGGASLARAPRLDRTVPAGARHEDQPLTSSPEVPARKTVEGRR